MLGETRNRKTKRKQNTYHIRGTWKIMIAITNAAGGVGVGGRGSSSSSLFFDLNLFTRRLFRRMIANVVVTTEKLWRNAVLCETKRCPATSV